MRVLIVDDDEMILDVWTIVLKKEGFEVITATNGKSGIDMAKTQKPDLVLLDQIMPDLRGNDVLDVIKQDPELKQIPVALVSNYNESQMMQDAIRLGAVDYILKYQIEPQDLVNKVKNLLQEQQAQAASSAPIVQEEEDA